MSDVVEHGGDREERESRPMTWRGRLVVALLVLAVAVAVSRSGLLSADAPERAEPPPTSSPAAAEASDLVAQVDDHLVRLGQDDFDDGPRLPGGVTTPLVPVLSFTGQRSLVGVTEDERLFRLATRGDAEPVPIGRARAVLAAATAPGRAVVWRGSAVAEVDIGTGRTLDEDPYPGYDEAAGWRPLGLVTVTSTRALLMRRAVPGAPGLELALAWPSVRVAAQFNPEVQPLGTYGRFLGIAGDWVLARAATCPGAGCSVLVVTVTRDDVLAREVSPPLGWTFVDGGPRYRTRSALQPVRRVDGDPLLALARLVTGGDNALLVRGTEGVDLDAGLADAFPGSVYLVAAGPAGGPERVRVWAPESPGRARLVPRGELPDTARLVCVCG
jgi:hypothetical protein